MNRLNKNHKASESSKEREQNEIQNQFEAFNREDSAGWAAAVCEYLRNRLRDARLVRNLSQVTLADALGIADSTLVTWEKDPRKMPVDKLLEIAFILQIPLDDLLPSSIFQRALERKQESLRADLAIGILGIESAMQSTTVSLHKQKLTIAVEHLKRVYLEAPEAKYDKLTTLAMRSLALIYMAEAAVVETPTYLVADEFTTPLRELALQFWRPLDQLTIYMHIGWIYARIAYKEAGERVSISCLEKCQQIIDVFRAIEKKDVPEISIVEHKITEGYYPPRYNGEFVAQQRLWLNKVNKILLSLKGKSATEINHGEIPEMHGERLGRTLLDTWPEWRELTGLDFSLKVDLVLANMYQRGGFVDPSISTYKRIASYFISDEHTINKAQDRWLAEAKKLKDEGEFAQATLKAITGRAWVASLNSLQLWLKAVNSAGPLITSWGDDTYLSEVLIPELRRDILSARLLGESTRAIDLHFTVAKILYHLGQIDEMLSETDMAINLAAQEKVTDVELNIKLWRIETIRLIIEDPDANQTSDDAYQRYKYVLYNDARDAAEVLNLGDQDSRLHAYELYTWLLNKAQPGVDVASDNYDAWVEIAENLRQELKIDLNQHKKRRLSFMSRGSRKRRHQGNVAKGEHPTGSEIEYVQPAEEVITPQKVSKKISLSPEIRLELQDRVKPQAADVLSKEDVLKAKVILAAATGTSDVQIAANLGVPRLTVRKWRLNYMEHAKGE